MKYWIIFLISFNSYSATQINDCGSYGLYGEIKKNDQKKSYDFVINQGSMSEYTFELTASQEKQIIPYLDHSLKIRATIGTMTSRYHGKFDSISKIEHTPPDPANLNERGSVALFKKELCK